MSSPIMTPAPTRAPTTAPTAAVTASAPPYELDGVKALCPATLSDNAVPPPVMPAMKKVSSVKQRSRGGRGCGGFTIHATRREDGKPVVINGNVVGVNGLEGHHHDYDLQSPGVPASQAADFQPCNGAVGRIESACHVDKSGESIAIVRKYIPKSMYRQIEREGFEVLNCSCHPNVVKYLSIKDCGDEVAIEMEMMDYGSLRNLLDAAGGPLPLDIVRHIAVQLFMGIEYLHSYSGRMHRDIKPGNLLLNRQGRLKITDFDTAKQGKANEGETFTGTRIYMSPERIKNESHGRPSDIWSAGIILLECILGRHPLEARSPTNTDSHIFAQINMSTNGVTIPDGLDEELADVLRRCLQVKAERRATARQLLQMPFIAHVLKADDPQHQAAKMAIRAGIDIGSDRELEQWASLRQESPDKVVLDCGNGKKQSIEHKQLNGMMRRLLYKREEQSNTDLCVFITNLAKPLA